MKYLLFLFLVMTVKGTFSQSKDTVVIEFKNFNESDTLLYSKEELYDQYSNLSWLATELINHRKVMKKKKGEKSVKLILHNFKSSDLPYSKDDFGVKSILLDGQDFNIYKSFEYLDSIKTIRQFINQLNKSYIFFDNNLKKIDVKKEIDSIENKYHFKTELEEVHPGKNQAMQNTLFNYRNHFFYHLFDRFVTVERWSAHKDGQIRMELVMIISKENSFPEWIENGQKINHIKPIILMFKEYYMPKKIIRVK